jgi:uncharacterized membrane protein
MREETLAKQRVLAIDDPSRAREPDGSLRAPAHALTAATPRKPYLDVFRGLLMAHMALDHASLMFNAARGDEELAARAPMPPADVLQFLTRFTGVPVAPGFCFMAGFMVALTSLARERRGVPASQVTRRLVVRGLVLIGVDAVVLGLPRLVAGFYSFMVLSSIGASVLLLAAVRHVRSSILLPLSLAVLLLHPLLDISSLPLPLRAILYEPVRSGAVRSLYPVVPWSAVVLLGFVFGRDAFARERSPRFWWALCGASLTAFLLVRLGGGYGNAYSHSGPFNLDFWSFAKYPPDLAFLSWSLAIIFLGLAILGPLCRSGVPSWLAPVAVFGRVPFFFYVVHFYVLGIWAAVLRQRYGLGSTYLIWLCLLAVMAWPCIWYERKKRERPNLVTRYF